MITLPPLVSSGEKLVEGWVLRNLPLFPWIFNYASKIFSIFDREIFPVFLLLLFRFNAIND